MGVCWLKNWPHTPFFCPRCPAPNRIPRVIQANRSNACSYQGVHHDSNLAILGTRTDLYFGPPQAPHQWLRRRRFHGWHSWPVHLRPAFSHRPHPELYRAFQKAKRICRGRFCHEPCGSRLHRHGHRSTLRRPSPPPDGPS